MKNEINWKNEETKNKIKNKKKLYFHLNPDLIQ